MKITKFGHCCMLIEDNGVRVVTDPGNWNEIPAELSNIDAIVITHNHGDHLHIDHIQQILKQNPQATIIGNTEVKDKLAEYGYDFVLVEEGENYDLKGMKLDAYGNMHSLIHADFKKFQNTGFMFNERLFYPGDALTIPTIKVELLALPVAGPWLKVSESVDYAKNIKPKIAFPIHDANIKKIGGEYLAPQTLLPPEGIEFKILELNQEYEF